MEFLHIRNIVILIVTALLIGELSAQPQDEAKEIQKALYKSCSGKFPLSDEIRANAKNGIFSDDRNLKCFIMCSFDELSLIDDEATIDGEAMISIATEDKKLFYQNVVEKCLPNIAGKPDKCEVAFNFVKCSINIGEHMVKVLPF